MEKIMNIFNFLKEFNELSNPVITEIKNQKWDLNISDIPLIEEIKSVFQGHEMKDLTFLEVRRPALLPCPKPEVFLIEWIESDWMKLSVDKVIFKEKISRELINKDGEVSYIDEYFEENTERFKTFELWVTERDIWRAKELPKEKGLNLYNNLFQLYSEIKRDSESFELILGDGNIRWNVSGRIINHPVLLQKAEISFNAHVPSFEIHCEEVKTELYMPMLRVIPSINQKMLSDIITDINEGEYEITQLENTKPLFKRIINVVDTKGTYTENARTITTTPIIYPESILFLRKRTLGYSNFIQGIIEELQENPEIKLPDFFGTMAGIYNKAPQEQITEKRWNYNGIDKDVLLTLPANAEQLRIIKYLEKYGAVLVQGPPGTGKTHSIANLIGHLLSQGKNVLVTSHTTKALAVLKDKVYKDSQNPEMNLQSLCINLSGSASQKKEMDEVINEIAEKSSSLDLHNSKDTIKRLEEERTVLFEESKKLIKRLTRVRSQEYKDLIYDNHTVSPIDAAKFLHEGKEIYDHITGESNDDETAFPLSNEDIIFLYEVTERLSKEEELLLKKDYPDMNQVFDSIKFEKIINRIDELKDEIDKNRYIKEVEISIGHDSVNELLDKSVKLVSRIHNFEPIEKSIINVTMVNPTYPELWDDVIKKTEEIPSRYISYNKLKLNDDFSINSDLIEDRNLITLKEIIDSGKEKPVGLFSKASWKKMKKAVRINGNEPEKRDEFKKVNEIISYEVEKEKTIRRVRKLLTGIVDPEKIKADDFENKIHIYREKFIEALTWFQNNYQRHFSEVENSIKWKTSSKLTAITSVNNIDTALNDLNTISDLFQAQISMNELNKLNNIIADYKMLLYKYTDENLLMDDLVKSVQAYKVDSYKNHLKSLNELIGKRDLVNRRETLLTRIGKIAPSLSVEIERREGIHSQATPPKDFDKAWKYFQIKSQMKRLDEENPAKIQSAIENNNNALFKNSRKLAYEKAWHEKINNQTDEQNQALQGWRNTIKQIGKGKGKKAPMLKAKARDLMPRCQSAIPVWIMPLNRVVENFNPGSNKFDVIIIDEASQANILSLSVLYMAKKVIIVGDDEQVSPNIVGIKDNEVSALITQHLKGVPNSHLFNGLTSLYDIAKSSGFRPLMLTEHFRCLPDIIEFSNRLSYNGKIKPLRDSSNVLVYPPVVEYRVPYGLRNGQKINEAEATHIVSLIQAFMDTDEYANQTIGVISMLGADQSSLIESKLHEVIDPVMYEQRKIQCGTPPQFQGDERDIIILSLVDGPNKEGGPLRLLSEDGYNDKYRKRYNVAVSRAKNQLWIVHSLNPDIDLKPDDLRLKLIKYAMNPLKENDSLLRKSESPFEMEVMKYLLNENYNVKPQYRAGAYRIDMVIQYEDKKVALECDGERWHNADNLQDDLARQAILERLGWRFIRIRGSVYYRDPDQTMKEVIKALAEYDIHPSYEKDGLNPERENLLIDIVKKKAKIYRDDKCDESSEDGGKEEGVSNNKNQYTPSQTEPLIPVKARSRESNKKGVITKKPNKSKDDYKKDQERGRTQGKLFNLEKTNGQKKLFNNTSDIKKKEIEDPKFDCRNGKKVEESKSKKGSTSSQPYDPDEPTDDLPKAKFDFR